jgi:fatty-acyl-CoA synthase
MTTLTRAERGADPVDIRDTTVAGILRAAARRAPDTTALVWPGPTPAARQVWSYAELWEAAEQAAATLQGRLRPGERIAVWGPSRPESLILTYAAAMARLVLVPANPAWREGELAHVLARSGAVALVHEAVFRGDDLGSRLESVRADLPSLRHVWTFDEWSEATRASTDDPKPDDPAPDDVAQLVFTSGTTGLPKGARLTHRGLTNAARLGAERFALRVGDVYVQTMPLFHVGGQVVSFQICQALATAVMVGGFDPATILELIERERATVTVGVPAMLLALVEHPDFSRRDLSTLHSVSSGGAVVPAELVRDIEAGLGVKVTISFGQTEACGFIAQTDPDDDVGDKASTLGRPLPGLEARVVGVEDGAVVDVGEIGELWVRGFNVMVGYHDPAPDSPRAPDAEGWLHTGDLVTMDGRGYLRIVGRRGDMIIRGGENIYPAEVEAVLRTHPDVSDVAVVGVPDERWGEVPVAFVRLVPASRALGADLEAWGRDRLAAFKVPRRWEVVDELPRTASGKVQRFVLAGRLTDA